MGSIIMFVVGGLLVIACVAIMMYAVLERVDDLKKKVDHNTKVANENVKYFYTEIEKAKEEIKTTKGAVSNNHEAVVLHSEAIDKNYDEICKIIAKMDDIVEDIHTIDHNTNDIRRYYFNYITPVNELKTEPEAEGN